MSHPVLRTFALTMLAISTLSIGLTAGGAAAADPKPFTDEWCGYSITPGEDWKKGPLSSVRLPGVPRSVWYGPDQSNIVIFLQEPGVAVSPRFILDASAASQKQQLSANVSVQEIRDVAGMKAMWLVISAKGTGAAIDGKGDVETTQHWVAVPREKDVLVFLLTCPTAEHGKIGKAFEKVLGSLKIEGAQTAEQKAAK